MFLQNSTTQFTLHLFKHHTQLTHCTGPPSETCIYSGDKRSPVLHNLEVQEAADACDSYAIHNSILISYVYWGSPSGLLLHTFNIQNCVHIPTCMVCTHQPNQQQTSHSSVVL
jgi:hypothetical protein